MDAAPRLPAGARSLSHGHLGLLSVSFERALWKRGLLARWIRSEGFGGNRRIRKGSPRLQTTRSRNFFSGLTCEVTTLVATFPMLSLPIAQPRAPRLGYRPGVLLGVLHRAHDARALLRGRREASLMAEVAQAGVLEAVRWPPASGAELVDGEGDAYAARPRLDRINRPPHSEATVELPPALDDALAPALAEHVVLARRPSLPTAAQLESLQLRRADAPSAPDLPGPQKALAAHPAHRPRREASESRELLDRQQHDLLHLSSLSCDTPRRIRGMKPTGRKRHVQRMPKHINVPGTREPSLPLPFPPPSVRPYPTPRTVAPRSPGGYGMVRG